MHSFSPNDFFDLTEFPFANLFSGKEFVWDVLKEIEKFLLTLNLGKIEGKIEKGATLIHPEKLSIGKGSLVEAGAYIVGPCVIGNDCQIRHSAYLRGNILTGNMCVIGHATEAKNAIFLNGAQAGHFAYVGDTICGNNVNLGAGTKCANLRFDKKNIVVDVQNRKIDTGLRKFGAIFGDESQTGCNSVTNPGTLMGKKSMLFPLATVKGVVEAGEVIKAPEKSISFS